jgi:hypothetical protein
MTITNALIEDIINHLAGSSTPTLEFNYVVFTSNFDVPNQSTTLASDNREIGRVAVDSITDNGSSLTVNYTLDSATANCLSTTVSGASSNTVFDLTSVTGLGVNDRIQITLNGVEYDRKVTNISTNTITVTPPLPSTPSVSDIVKQKISRIALVYNGTASSGTGTVGAWNQYIVYKDSTMSIPGAFPFLVKGN